MFHKRLNEYLIVLDQVVRTTHVTDADGKFVSLSDGCEKSREIFHSTKSKNKIIFIGNGGSAGIASHMAIDYSKNGKLPSTALNDPASLTCLANDFGYEHVFSKQIEFYAKSGDVLVAISSSGNSKNILHAAHKAYEKDCKIITFSGFNEYNSLRSYGDLNFWVPSDQYGFVELSHQILLHAILDIDMGWKLEYEH